MVTKNKKITILIALYFCILCTTSCSSILFSSKILEENNYRCIAVLGYRNDVIKNTNNHIPSYSFYIPSSMCKWEKYDIGKTIIGLSEQQYICVIYDIRIDLDYQHIMSIIEDFTDSTNDTKMKKLNEKISSKIKTNRSNSMIRVNNFYICLINIRDNKKDDLIQLIKKSFVIK